jgi:pyrroline-5-carboxylate reductase
MKLNTLTREIIAFLVVAASPAISFFLQPSQLHGFRLSLTPTTFRVTTTDEVFMYDQPFRIGFIGCGTIASAIATGLARQSKISIESIAVSKRSASKSAALQRRLGSDLVTICDENQQIIDQSNIIFLTVLPQQTTAVLQALTFDPNRHVLISLVSTSNVNQLAHDACLSPNTDQVYKMICLPSVATNNGLCLLTPRPLTDASPVLSLLHALCRQVFVAETNEQLSAMMIPSGLMGSFYGILKNNRDFIQRECGYTMTVKETTELVAWYYQSMLQDVLLKLPIIDESTDLLETLIEEQTPGGINEQGWQNLRSLGAMDAYDQVQSCMLQRLRGETDGSLPDAGS